MVFFFKQEGESVTDCYYLTWVRFVARNDQNKSINLIPLCEIHWLTDYLTACLPACLTDWLTEIHRSRPTQQAGSMQTRSASRNCSLGFYSLSGRVSSREILWSLEAAKFGFTLFHALWYLMFRYQYTLPWFSIKMSFYQYRKSRFGDTIALSPK